MRLTYRIEELKAFCNGTLLPGKVRPTVLARHPENLSWYRHYPYYEWIIKLKGNKTRRQTINWIIAKWYSSYELNQGERILALLLSQNKYEYTIVDKMSRNVNLYFSERRIARPKTLTETCKRITRSYRPSVVYDKIFSPITLPPVQYIGVGYKDKGTLGSGPSWKEQILPGKEVPTSQEEFLFSILLSLGLHSSLEDVLLLSH